MLTIGAMIGFALSFILNAYITSEYGIEVALFLVIFISYACYLLGRLIDCSLLI